MTFGELRSAAHKLVLKLDPDAVRKRQEAARREAHVRRFREDSGNAGMVARELPSDEVLASWQHVEQRALDLRAAGMPGTLQDLRVRAYLDLLQERDSRVLAAGPAGTGDTAGTGRRRTSARTSRPRTPGQPGLARHQRRSRRAREPDGPGGRARRAWRPGRSRSPSRPGPHRAEPGRPGHHHRPPGHLAGPVRHPRRGRRVRPAGRRQRPRPGRRRSPAPPHPVVRHRAEPRRHRRRPRLPARPPPPARHRAARHHRPHPHPHPGPGPGPGPPPGTRPQDWIAGLRLTMSAIARGTCDHGHAEPGYQPSRKLRHLVRARNARCTAPGCGRPAARCDLDHTLAWDQGGITCECDLAPLCRHHHRCKQSQGWKLEQPSPGVLVWRTPAGRTYATTPTVYPL